MVSKLSPLLYLTSILTLGCGTFAAYKSRDFGGDHGYRESYSCNGEFEVTFRERISTTEAAVEKVKRRVHELIEFYDFESYEQSDVEIYDHHGQFIPVYGFAGSPPYVDAAIKLRVKGGPRRNSYLLNNGDLVVFAGNEVEQNLERYDAKQQKWSEFRGNEFLHIGDHIRASTGFFNTRQSTGLPLRVCYKKNKNTIIFKQDVEFIVQENGLQMVKGEIAYCTQDDLKKTPCNWPANFKGLASSLDYYGNK